MEQSSNKVAFIICVKDSNLHLYMHIPCMPHLLQTQTRLSSTSLEPASHAIFLIISFLNYLISSNLVGEFILVSLLFNYLPWLLLCEEKELGVGKMALRDVEATLPPGFRFYPSDEELVSYYLCKKVANESLSTNCTLVDVDLHTCEPWQLPGNL